MRRLPVYIAAVLAIALLVMTRPYLERKGGFPTAERELEPAVLPGRGAVDGPYFSDAGGIAEHVVAAIRQTRATLDIAMYDLTEPNIAGAIEAARRRGVRVRIVADEHQAREPYSEIPDLESHGILVRLSRGYRGQRSLMHDKFAVFDGQRAETGSFNWTTSGDRYNFENALFVSNPAVVSGYKKEFERLWGQAH